MAIEWLIAGAVAALAGGVAAYFWEDLKAWANKVIDALFWNVLDFLLGASVFILKSAWGYVKQVKGYYGYGGRTYQRVHEEEIPYNKLPKDIREEVDYYGSVETIRYR